MDTLQELLERREWGMVAEKLQHLLSNDASVLNVVNAIYSLQRSVEGGGSLPQGDFERLRQLLISFFQRSESIYGTDPVYLFFVGYLITLCEWCFGLDEFNEGYEMLKRASDSEPSNLLFMWAYAYATSQPNYVELSNLILPNTEASIFLRSSGPVGALVEEHIQNLPYLLQSK